jgi:cardiolipin synthase
MLSIFRILLVPFFVVAFFHGGENAHLYAALIYGLASLTDVLDGIIARRLKLITKLGRLLDPLADKLMAFTVLLCISIAGIVPGWAAAVFFVKEALMGAGALLMYNKTDDVIHSNFIGKAATVALFAVCVILMTFENIPSGAATAMVSLALCAMGVAFFNYLWKFVKIVRSSETVKKADRLL